MLKAIVISLGMFGLLLTGSATAVDSPPGRFAVPGQQVESFNANHPELQPGEVFLTNIDGRLRGPIGIYKDWVAIGHKTKRLGNVAYNIYGNIEPYLIPVFVQRSELLEKGIDPESLKD